MGVFQSSQLLDLSEAREQCYSKFFYEADTLSNCAVLGVSDPFV